MYTYIYWIIFFPNSKYIYVLYVAYPKYEYVVKADTDICRNKINKNDERTRFFRKIYLSHFIRNCYERVMCERWTGDWTETATYWPPVLLSSAALLSRSAGLLNRGPWGPSPLLRAGSHCLELQQLTPNKLNFLSHQVISLFDVHLLRVSVAFSPNSIHPRSKAISWCLRPDAPVPWSTAGSEVNMLQSYHNYFSKLYMWNFLHVRLHLHHTHIWQNNFEKKKHKKKLLEPQQKTKSNCHRNLFYYHCAVGYLNICASKYNTDASFILPNATDPSVIPWRIWKP